MYLSKLEPVYIEVTLRRQSKRQRNQQPTAPAVGPTVPHVFLCSSPVSEPIEWHQSDWANNLKTPPDEKAV